MIKLFRNIRNSPAGEAGKLVKEGKTGNYLKYDIGEIHNAPHYFLLSSRLEKFFQIF
jgi:hypothetical protein